MIPSPFLLHLVLSAGPKTNKTVSKLLLLETLSATWLSNSEYFTLVTVGP